MRHLRRYRCPHCQKFSKLPGVFRDQVAEFLTLMRKYNGNRTHVARKLGVSVRSVRYWISALREQNIDVAAFNRDSIRRRGKWTADEIEHMLLLVRQGWSRESIARELKRSPRCIIDKLKREKQK